MKSQITFPLETELVAVNALNHAETIIRLEPFEILEVELVSARENDTWDFYLGNYVFIHAVPGNFSIKEQNGE